MTPSTNEQALLVRIQRLEQELSSLRAECDRLALAEARWQALMDESPFGVVVYRPDGSVKAGNDGMQRLFSLSDKEAEHAQSVYNILEDQQLAEKGMAETVRKAFSGKPARLPCIEYELCRPNETKPVKKWIEGVFFPILRAENEVGEVVSIQIDVSELMAAQEDLRFSQERMSEHLKELDQLYATEPVGMCLVDTELRYLRINKRMAEINGPPPAAHLGKTIREIAPGIADRVESLYRRVIETGEPALDVEFHGDTPAAPGTERDWLVSYHPISGSDGAVSAVSTIVQDITEVKRTREELEESQHHLHTVIDNADLILWAIDENGVFTLLQGRALPRLGLEPGEVIGRSVFDLYADVPEIIESSRSALEGRAFSGTYELGDTSFAARYVPVFNDQGEPAGAIGVAIDITERRMAESALEQSESRFRQIAENIREAVWIFDLDQRRVIYASPAYEVITGRSVDELYAQAENWAADFHSRDLARVNRAIERLTHGQEQESLEVRIVRPDGELRWVTLQASAIRDETGRTRRLVGTTEDITELKREEEERQLFEARVQQAQKLESLGLLAGGIAHDFNNLLMGVLGNADLALLSLSPESPGYNYVERIQTAAQRASELANQMLAYSGKGRFVVGALDLNRLVKEMTHLLETVISKKVKLTVDLSSELPPIEADATQIRQVVMNLVTNASEAIISGSGAIRVSTFLIDAEEEYLSQCELGVGLVPGPYVCLEVSDTGGGISDEIRESMFDPFFTTKFTGRGLGLAATLGIVQSHGAAVRVESELDRGTTLSILFPPSSATLEPVKDENKESASERPQSATVLVVDDEAIVRDVARAMLQSAGYDVVVAHDGIEAVNIFRQSSETIDLVLLDMAMPGMDGRETYDSLRRIQEDVLVVLSSGYTEEEAVSKLGAGGMVDFVHKPYKLDALLQAVGKALSDGRFG